MSLAKRLLAVGIAFVTMGMLASHAAATAAPTLEITGATYTEIDDAAGLWTMRGSPIVIRRGDTVVQAPAITYDVRQQIVRATGGVMVRQGPNEARAQEITIDLRRNRLTARGQASVVVFPQQ